MDFPDYPSDYRKDFYTKEAENQTKAENGMRMSELRQHMGHIVRAKNIRSRIFEIIELSKDGDMASSIYDGIMMAVIICSLVPMAFKGANAAFQAIDKTATVIFLVDYALRLLTADYKLQKGLLSFILYPLTPMAVIDLLAILPSFTALQSGFRVLKLFRLLRTFRVFRAFKMFRYSKSLAIISNVIKSQRVPLVAVGTLALGYILISALIIFNVEPDTFENFFEAIYWATISLTTMGYGDIYPITTIGRIVTMISSFIGIAIVALPAGIVTAGYMEELNRKDDQ